MSNPYREYRSMVYTAGTMAIGADRYGDGTVYRGVESKDSAVPTIDYQSEASDARMDSIMLLEHLKTAIEVIEHIAKEYTLVPPYIQGNLSALKKTARDYDFKLTGEAK